MKLSGDGAKEAVSDAEVEISQEEDAEARLAPKTSSRRRRRC
jgi:hypothetical protein